jgi:hypothetical protein
MHKHCCLTSPQLTEVHPLMMMTMLPLLLSPLHCDSEQPAPLQHPSLRQRHAQPDHRTIMKVRPQPAPRTAR